MQLRGACKFNLYQCSFCGHTTMFLFQQKKNFLVHFVVGLAKTKLVEYITTTVIFFSENKNRGFLTIE
jgi:hypothetical protein